eukprot:CAMPEP_0185753684 /NCGR_PEP_ID=MMETSP1174-20130828/12400_1 /TAXON_ID=35687 /ORGANISM="Dictyocha speculum, Strain CCMP1381" /LENGTH=95 /DNA_ID=CAMNT_0028431637 /DNA_START=166 /DNA_END=453 /DNA_ORIENTATION=-
MKWYERALFNITDGGHEEEAIDRLCVLCHCLGDFEDEETKEAIRRLMERKHPAAIDGDCKAQYIIGFLSYRIFGAKKSKGFSDALRWLSSAHENG